MKRIISFLSAILMLLTIIPAAGAFADDVHEHNFVEIKRVKATCTEDGYIEYECQDGGVSAESSPVSIIGQSRLTVDQLLKFSDAQISKMRLTCTLAELIGYYISIGNKYNIRGDIAYLQAINETGWFKFNRPGSYWMKNEEGVWVKVNEPRPEGLYATPEDNNFCGLGITGRLGDESKLCRFATAELGVTAHIQHLYAYATKAALPEGETLVDPRFGLMERGCATTWIALGEDHWTNSATYGTSIENSYFSALKNYAAPVKGCGEIKKETIPATGHNWGEWKTTIEATATEQGYKERECIECNETETEIIPALSEDPNDSKWSEWFVTVPATFDQAGEMTRFSNGTFERQTDVLPKLTGKIGDIDNDEMITVADALAVLRVAAKMSSFDGRDWLMADVDRDQKITSADALVVLRCAAKLADIDNKQYSSYDVVTMNNTRNETFRTIPNDSDKSLPQYYWLPKDTTDVIMSHSVCSSDSSLDYYTLRCGLRVYTKDATVSKKALLNNKVMGAKVENNGKFTDFTLAVTQKTPYRVKAVGLFPEGDTDASTATSSKFTKFEVIVPYSEAINDIQFNENPLFSDVSVIKNDTEIVYSFTLKKIGMFCGYSSYFDDAGNLVIHMHNPMDVTGGRLDGAVICLDAGHGGNDTGASGYINEAEENAKVLIALRTKLQSLGATVYYTRDNQTYYSDGTKITKSTLSDYRVNLIASFKPDLLISIHHNDYTDPSAHGTEALYFYGFNQALAQKVSDKISEVSGMRNRGGKYQNVFVYRNHDFMSFLVECGFVGNKEDSTWLSTPGNTEKLADAIIDGIIEYFS